MSAHPVAIPKEQSTSALDTSSSVDTSHDLSPHSPADVGRIEKLIARRSSVDELKEKGILKGDPNDALAGKRADLEKSMRSDRLDKELHNRPTADELVQKGILSREEADAM